MLYCLGVGWQKQRLCSLDKMVAHIVSVRAHYNTNNMEAKTEISPSFHYLTL